MDLILERKSQQDEPLIGGFLAITPPIDEDYWSYRVQVGGGQAIVGFPKFSTVGVGFAVEGDWNTNLPFRCHTDDIWHHIKHNRGAATATDDEIKRAIDMVCEAASLDRGQPRDMQDRVYGDDGETLR